MDKNGSENDENQLENVLTKTILNLEEIDTNLYRGTHMWKGSNSVFGGQVVGQALVAAGKTVKDELHVHSLHCYFIVGGKSTKPILYHVHRSRDGRSFSTRLVEARQDGHVIFTMLVSYQKQEIYELTYQTPMPQVPPPEEVPSVAEIVRSILESESLPLYKRREIKSLLASDIVVEVKPLDFKAYMREQASADNTLLFWVRAKGHVGENRSLHMCVAAYISDFGLLRSSVSMWPEFRVTFMTSLDHVMWFHAPFQADDWILYECITTRSGGGRSLVVGRLWRKDGVLAASVSQEGLVRGHFKESKL